MHIFEMKKIVLTCGHSKPTDKKGFFTILYFTGKELPEEEEEATLVFVQNNHTHVECKNQKSIA